MRLYLEGSHFVAWNRKDPSCRQLFGVAEVFFFTISVHTTVNKIDKKQLVQKTFGTCIIRSQCEELWRSSHQLAAHMLLWLPLGGPESIKGVRSPTPNLGERVADVRSRPSDYAQPIFSRAQCRFLMVGLV